ncbi:MAG: hypothetical protein JXB03_06915 [Spirochaetales bacterium]|nr:hypothetical protein [Spirochaetales bacterium]
MAINAVNLFPIVEELSTHYKNNLSNRFLRKALNQLTLSRSDWELIDDLLESSDFVRMQSYSYVELYERIYACAQLVDKTRTEIGTNIRAFAGVSVFSGSQQTDKVLLDMAVSNFASNMSIFADAIHNLYLKTVEEDKAAHKGGSPDFLRVPELKNIGKMLVG